MWTGIANRYKHRSPRLIFEVVNEPGGQFGDWSGGLKVDDPIAISRTREINLIGYIAIRATGGQNSTRVVVVEPNGQGNQSQLDDVYPTADFLPKQGKDPYLMVSVHTYDPWTFCGEDGKMTEAPTADAVRGPILQVATHTKKLGVPCNYGEFGVGRRDRQSDRDSDSVRNYYNTVWQTVTGSGMSATPWDDRGWFGLIDRQPDSTYTFRFGIVPAMMIHR